MRMHLEAGHTLMAAHDFFLAAAGDGATTTTATSTASAVKAVSHDVRPSRAMVDEWVAPWVEGQ